MLADGKPDSPRYTPFLPLLYLIYLVYCLFCLLSFYLYYTYLMLMLYVLALSVELSRPIPAKCHLFSILTILQPMQIIVQVPLVDFLSCRAGWGFQRLGWAPSIQVVDFHSIAFKLAFNLSSEIVCTDIVFCRSLVLLFYLLDARSLTNVRSWGGLLYLISSIFVFFLLIVITFTSYGYLPRG